MTWDELKEKAEKLKCYYVYSGIGSEWITDGCWTFDEDGIVKLNGDIISIHRTPEQMLMIMRGLE